MDKEMLGGVADPMVAGATAGSATVLSRSEDEESAGGKDVKRTATQAFSGVVPKRRSSSRSIKRKKFDDELVESSLVKSSSRVKGPPVMEPARFSGSETSSAEKKKLYRKYLELSRGGGTDEVRKVLKALYEKGRKLDWKVPDCDGGEGQGAAVFPSVMGL